MDLSGFADEVGAVDPVTVVGGRTQWEVGGLPVASAREVRAPAGVVEYEPAEMIVRCGAGTPVDELDAVLREGGQTTVLPSVDGATVGGVLAVGRSDVRRLRHGPLRDAVLEARFVSSEGRLVKAGGPVVKNVSGYDLCRLLVGSLGTIGLLAEVVLRAVPRPPVAEWWAGPVDPFALRRLLFRPSALLWDGTTTWALLEGPGAEVRAEADALPPAMEPVEGPPPLPTGGRWSRRPSTLRDLGLEPGSFVAEVGVGVVHTVGPAAPSLPDPSALALHRRIKAAFDPEGRLNPGRNVLVGA